MNFCLQSRIIIWYRWKQTLTWMVQTNSTINYCVDLDLGCVTINVLRRYTRTCIRHAQNGITAVGRLFFAQACTCCVRTLRQIILWCKLYALIMSVYTNINEMQMKAKKTRTTVYLKKMLSGLNLSKCK